MTADTVLLPAVLFAAPPPTKVAPVMDEGDEEGGWEQELADSPRSSRLKAAILALVAALSAVAGRLPRAVSIPDDRSPMNTADAALTSVHTALSAYETQATAALDRHIPRVADALSRYVADTTGVTRPASEAVAQSLTDTISQYLTGDAATLRQATHDAVIAWHTSGGTITDLRAALDGVLSDAEWQTTRTVVSEVQHTYIDLFRAGVDEAGTEKVRRIVMPDACEEICAPLAGVHWADDPALYDSHPHCECDWEPADPEDEVDFSRTVRGPFLALAEPNTARGGVYVLAGGGR